MSMRTLRQSYNPISVTTIGVNSINGLLKRAAIIFYSLPTMETKMFQKFESALGRQNGTSICERNAAIYYDVFHQRETSESDIDVPPRYA